ncbi:MAG: CoA pyrophosphatase [Bacteroidota bacterium]
MEVPYSDELITQIRNRLEQPLPGWDAQSRMATEIHRRARVQVPPTAQQAGVLLLLYPGADQQLSFPLIQRPQYEGAHSGQVAFPGGKVEPEDQSIVATARRETREEIGVEVSEGQILGQLTDLYIPVSQFVVSPVVAYTDQPLAYQPDPTEVAAVLDVSAQSFMRAESHSIQNIQVRNISLKVPAYTVQNKVIWGATAMMLSEFFAVLETVSG